jgi:hypothetical protein
MTELLFGSAPQQVWPSSPAIPQSSFGPVPSFVANRSTMIVPPGAEMPNITTTVTPQALLTTVAIRRGQLAGPTNEQDVEDFIYDALELLPGSNDIDVRCENGRVTLSGTVAHKRLKRDAGEVVWAIPSVNDVMNNITIATRRRSRPQTREMEGTPSPAGRKPA